MEAVVRWRDEAIDCIISVNVDVHRLSLPPVSKCSGGRISAGYIPSFSRRAIGCLSDAREKPGKNLIFPSFPFHL